MDKVRLTEMLTRHEGLRLKPYTDTAGKLTIGIGRNLTDVGISKEEANILLMNDISRAISDLDSHIYWWRDLDSACQMVLVNMCFNLGITKLLKFKNTLRLIEEGKYEDASVHMLKSRWAEQVKGRAKELANILRTGVL